MLRIQSPKSASLPTQVAEYRGQTIEGRKLPAKIYSYATGGVFEAQVEFQRDQAIIYGSQLAIRLRQSTIRDPSNIVGYGRVGQIPFGRSLSIGIGADPTLNGSMTAGGSTLNDLWSIRLLPESLSVLEARSQGCENQKTFTRSRFIFNQQSIALQESHRAR